MWSNYLDFECLSKHPSVKSLALLGGGGTFKKWGLVGGLQVIGDFLCKRKYGTLASFSSSFSPPCLR
jgi:hypothetical protein